MKDTFTKEESELIETFAEWQSVGYEWDAYPDHCYFLDKKDFEFLVTKYNFRTGVESYTKKFKTIENLMRFYKKCSV